MTVTEAVLNRRATPAFDPSMAVPMDELLALMNRACLAPSALNLQPWRFLVCADPDDKERLWQVGFHQEKLRHAGVVVVVFGDLLHHLNAPRIAEGNVSPEADSKEQWVALANQAYGGSPGRARDEAFRGCSLWAMTFVLLATEAGWDTSLIGGFDEAGLTRSFGIEDRYVPVLLVAIGRMDPSVERKPRSDRMLAEDLLQRTSR